MHQFAVQRLSRTIREVVALPLIALEFDLKDIGTTTLLYMLIGTSLLGAVITLRFGIETKGVNLETIGQVSRRGGR
jgi:hypothetical protein